VSKRLKVVFLGLNDIGKKVLDYLKSIDQDDIFLITEKDQLVKIKSVLPDIILSVGFRSIVPKEYISIPRLGAINFHKSLLPLHRGANPVFWTILGQTKAGVTIHYMDENIDTGDIIKQREVGYSFNDTAASLYRRLENVQLELFKDTWPDIRSDQIEPYPQEGESSYHIIENFKALRRINFENNSFEVINFINYLKAMTFPPFNNAFIEINNEKYYIELNIKEKGSSNSSDTLLKQYEVK